MKIYVINGPNLNLLGVREPSIYGRETYFELKEKIRSYAEEKGVSMELFQSNHEGDLVDFIHRAYYQKADGIIINPGGYTHTSVALADAVKAVGIPTVEVHISDVNSREDFRKISYIREVVTATVSGKGTNGYLEALDMLIKENNK